MENASESPGEHGEASCFGVVILSAGASRRMGRPKALLPWGEKTVLEHVLDTWREVGATQVAVVYDPENAALMAEMDRLRVMDRIANANPEEGMMSSLRAAARWEGWRCEVRLIAVALVDQPLVRVVTIRQLAVFASGSVLVIAQPEVNGKRGHPVFFSREMFAQVAEAREQNLRDFIHQRVALRTSMLCEDGGVLADMDTPERYEQMRKAEFGRI